MFRTVRALPVTCLITSLVTTPWTHAIAAEQQVFTPVPQAERIDGLAMTHDRAAEGLTTSTPDGTLARLSTWSEPSGVDGSIWRTAAGSMSNQSHLLSRSRQSVATTNEPKLLLGAIAGTLIVAGVAMLAYGATSACKGSHPNDTTCDRNTVLGAVGLSGGTVMLVVWALSK